METKNKEVYEFEELSESVQEALLDKADEYTLDSDWYEYILDDAANIGLTIDTFDVDNHQIYGDLTEYLPQVLTNILDQHNVDADTYQTALNHQAILTASNARADELDLQLREKDFVRDILEDYLNLLRQEVERLCYNAYIQAGTNLNGNLYFEDGQIYRETSGS